MAERDELTLVGDDSQIFTGETGDTYEGDGSKTLSDLVDGDTAEDPKLGAGMYLIAGIAATGSVLPAGMKVGELFPALGTEVLAVGDKLTKLNLSHIADATGWSLQITQSEIETTRLIDSFKKYRLGKKDATGTLNSIMTLGVSDDENGLIAKTMKLFRREAGGTTKVIELDNKPLYFCGYVRKTDTPGETEAFVFGQIYIYNITLGGSTGNAQSYDSSMRLTGVDPVFYSTDIPLAG